METSPQNIYLVYKKKFEETGSLEAKAVMEEYKAFAPVEVKVVEEVKEVKKFTLPSFTKE